MPPWGDGRPLDVSVTIRPGMPAYPSDPGAAVELAKSSERGDPANLSLRDLAAIRYSSRASASSMGSSPAVT